MKRGRIGDCGDTGGFCTLGWLDVGMTRMTGAGIKVQIMLETARIMGLTVHK
jgi:hypothetical protein